MTNSDSAIARRAIDRARILLEGNRPAAASRAFAKALEFIETEGEYADAHDVGARIAEHNGDREAALASWYQVAGALRNVLDAPSECDGCRTPDEAAEADGSDSAAAVDVPVGKVLARFARTRLRIAYTHADRGECLRAATAVDEAIGRLWPVAGESGELRDLLDECLVVRVRELIDQNRLGEAEGIASVLEDRAATMLPPLAAGAWESVGVVRRNAGHCACSASAFEKAVDGFTALAKEEPEEFESPRILAALALGVERVHLQDYEKAIDVLAGAIRDAREVADRSTAMRARFADALHASGRALEAGGRCAEAAEAFAESAAAYEEDGNEPGASMSFADLAESRAHLGLFAGAHEAWQKAAALAWPDDEARANLFRLKGSILEREGREEEAWEAFAQADAIGETEADA